MPCCKNKRRRDAAVGGRRVALKGLAAAALGWCLAATVYAGDTLSTDIPAAPSAAGAVSAASAPSLVRRADGLYLSASVPLDISSAMEDVLRKGVPLYFQWQADVYQRRWYWIDREVASTARTVRLAYQPLTRHWRLSYGAGGPSSTGLQYALSQNYENLADALLAAGKVRNWKIADAAHWTADSGQRVELRFALDLTQLPRPFQLSLFNQGGWNLTYQKTLAIPERVTAESDTDAGTASDDKAEPAY